MKFSFLKDGNNQISKIDKNISELSNILKKSKKREDFLENHVIITNLFKSIYYSLEFLITNLDNTLIHDKLNEIKFQDRIKKILEQYFFLYEKHRTKPIRYTFWIYFLVCYIHWDQRIKTKNKTLRLLLFLSDKTLPFEFLITELMNELENIKCILSAIFTIDTIILKKTKIYNIFLKIFEYLHVNTDIFKDLINFSLTQCLLNEGKICNLLYCLEFLTKKSTNSKKIISTFIDSLKNVKIDEILTTIKYYEKIYDLSRFVSFNTPFEIFILFNTIKNKLTTDEYTKTFLSMLEISSLKNIFEDYLSIFNISESMTKKLSEFEYTIKIKLTGEHYKIFLKELILYSSKIIKKTIENTPKSTNEFLEVIKANKLLYADPIVSVMYDILKNKRREYEIIIKYKIEPKREYVYLNNKLLPLTANNEYISFIKTIRYLILPYSLDHYKIINNVNNYEKNVNIGLLEKVIGNSTPYLVFVPYCYDNKYFLFLLPNKKEKFLLVFKIRDPVFINKLLIPQNFKEIASFIYKNKELFPTSYKDIINKIETVKVNEVLAINKLK